ncbi:MAG: efflux RND transporter periplasmic adaptor subunit [Lachnospiraceae bacterium]|nr:efflux RND transporter periplasmic adaptor subunit [Lachnospiraceae bacterium]
MSKRKMSRKKKIQLFLVILLLLIIIFAACFTLFIKPAMEAEEWVYKENTAEYGKLQNGITESGTVEFITTSQLYELDITTDEEDDSDDDEDEDEDYLKVEEVYVAVGQRIQEGDAVYKFTEDSVADVRKALTYAKTEAEIALAEAKTSYDIGVKTASLSYDETMLAKNLAQQSYDATVSRLNTEVEAQLIQIDQLLDEILELQLSITSEDYIEQKDAIIEAYEDAVEKVEDVSEDYFTNQIEAAQQLKSAKESYENFFERLDSSNEQIQSKIDEVYEIQTQMAYDEALSEKELLEAKQEYESAQVKGEIAKTQYDNDMASYENALTKAQNELDEITAKLDAFEAFVGDGTVYAQGTGLVTEVGYAKDDYLISQGTLLSYVTSDAMTITVDVFQEDVVMLQVGDSVEINLTAYEDEVYQGIVDSITTTSTSQGSATISYPVVIAIQGDTSKIYGGMTADVTFVIEETEDIVYVSRKAIVEKRNKEYVYIKNGDSYELTPVTTGFTDGIYVEITEGLEAGDTYYIASVVSGEAQ